MGELDSGGEAFLKELDEEILALESKDSDASTDDRYGVPGHSEISATDTGTMAFVLICLSVVIVVLWLRREKESNSKTNDSSVQEKRRALTESMIQAWDPDLSTSRLSC